MEFNLTVLVLIGCGSGLLAGMVIVVCFACCHFLIKRQTNKRRGLKQMEHRMVYEVESPRVMKMARYQPLTEDTVPIAKTNATKTSPITKQPVEGSGKNSHYIFDEETVVNKAVKEDRLLLWTNTGLVIQANDHTLSLFILSNIHHPSEITDIYMKGSPCYTCSTKLIEHFKYCPKKPTLYLSNITHTDSISDKEGLRGLLQAGFDVKVWKHLNQRMGNDNTEKYIRDLKKDTDMYSYFGIFN